MSKRKFLTIALTLALVGVMALALAGCGGKEDSGKTLKFVGQDYAGGNLDPSNMDNAGWQMVRMGIGETLFKFDENSKPVPWLCKEVKTNDDKSEWVLTLNKGIKFSNGTELTASLAKASIERLYKNEKEKKGTSTPSTYLVYKTLTADDKAGTLTITVDPTNYINVAAALAHPTFVIIDTSSKEDIATKPISTGPYAVKSITEKKNYTLEKNKNYWKGDVPYEEVVFTCNDDASAKALALKGGDVDVAENITSVTDLNELKKNKDYEVLEVEGNRTAFTFINQREGKALANKDLRLAVNMAIDDKTLCEKTVGGLYAPGTAILPTSIDFGSKDVRSKTDFNIEKAKEILDKAGIKDSDKDGIRELNGKNIELTYLTYTSRNLHEFAEAHGEALKEIGIKCKVKKTDPDTQWNKLVAGEFDLGNQNWNVMQSGDPQGFLKNFYSKGENNYGKFASAKYDKLYDELLVTKDDAKRKEICTKLQQIIEDEAAVIVNGYYKSNICWNKKVSGVKYQAMDYYWITKDIMPSK